MAYFGTVTIKQGAAGLGQPPVDAYRSGSLGGLRRSLTGLRRSMGQPPVDAYRSGSLGQPPVDAYHSGSLGSLRRAVGQPPVEAYHSGTLGEYFEGVGQPPVDAYHSGSLGWEQAAAGIGQPPVDAYHSGSLGWEQAAAGIAGFGQSPVDAYHSGSLGADASVLDMKDPNVIREVKTAIGMHPALIGTVATMEGQKTWDIDYYKDPIWDKRAKDMWNLAIAKLPALGQGGTIVVGDPSDGLEYPSAIGLMTILATGVGAPAGDARAFSQNFPKLSAWYPAALAAPRDAAVSPPFFSDEQKVQEDEGGPGFQMSKMAMFGLGGALLVGALVIFGRRKS